MSATTTDRNRIQRLPPSVVNKIAAGEVIERPASVVKELLENAVDSGARQIDLTVQQGGLELIRVADDGCGISADDLPLAVAPHATSKISDADDLFKVATLGFRGEALASIAEISHLTIRSRVASDSAGYELRVTGGEAEPLAPCGAPVGTVVEVRNLFFNTPVRQKFLRTHQTEMGHVTEAFTRVALAHPEVHFVLRHNERTLYDLPGNRPLAERIGLLFGEEIRGCLIPIEGRDGGVQLSGFVIDPTQSRTHNRMQYLFLNGRFIRERSLQHALGEAYRGLLLVGRYPICFLQLQMPPEIVDVNVHPAKLEVRFVDGGRLYSLVLGTIRNTFLSTDLTAHSPRGAEPFAQPAAPGGMEAPSSGPGLGGSRDLVPPTSQASLPIDFPRSGVDWTAAPRPKPELPAYPAVPTFGGEPPFQPFPDGSKRAAPPNPSTETVAVGGRAMQVHNRYLITENEDGMVVIDQHALHERILYEQLRHKVTHGALETQRLLVPEPVSLTATEWTTVQEARDILQQIGIDVRDFGGNTVLVESYPAMLANHNPAEMLRALVERLQTQAASVQRRDVLDELLHMIACKAAVKAGDRLSAAEIDALLEHRQLCQDAHHCPHGRPTALVLTREELDRRFKRT